VLAFLEAERACDFVARMANTRSHRSVNDVVSNARFTNGEVKRPHTSSLLSGGNPPVGNHDTHTPACMAHGAVRESYGVDAV
jgi:hypothetical protein